MSACGTPYPHLSNMDLASTFGNISCRARKQVWAHETKYCRPSAESIRPLVCISNMFLFKVLKKVSIQWLKQESQFARNDQNLPFRFLSFFKIRNDIRLGWQSMTITVFCIFNGFRLSSKMSKYVSKLSLVTQPACSSITCTFGQSFLSLITLAHFLFSPLTLGSKT